MATPGDAGLGAEVVPGLAEEVDGALVGEPSTRRRITAEASVFGHQRVGAVTEPACREQQNTEMRKRPRSRLLDQSSLTRTISVGDGLYLQPLVSAALLHTRLLSLNTPAAIFTLLPSTCCHLQQLSELQLSLLC